jgi:hypothetical protein
MKTFSFYWNPKIDKTRVVYMDEFNNSGWIVKADVLKDAIGILEEEYIRILKQRERTDKT